MTGLRAETAAGLPLQRRGLMLIVSSPSGAGKTTLTRLLLAEDRDIDLSISVTTRPKRPSEVNHVHYHFIAASEFERMRDQRELLESAKVHGNFYGTPIGPVEKALAAGRDVLFDIDWQGTVQIYERMRPDIVSVFVLPPSAAELKARLERRAENTAEDIGHRLQNARVEIGHWSKYDYVLVNNDLDSTFVRLKAILDAERQKRAEKARVAELIERLKADLDAMAVP
ncbi:guanylate kinase [Labrys wisconsinensis]|uniref:Guanylate kinase n=1 Tax=Labrys wisconsinensis TaxID=425677 RepID=A0ABU0J230_9HYPH|nr:guanylate kinase [Labrys wisconsinensis]MDQ0468307.1 guanylate kinase [Labrys wisconsinensis]